jgi:predicted secreted protein
MTEQIGGFGLAMRVSVTGTMTALVALLDGELPEFEKFVAEMTSHSASGGYAEYVATGKRKMNEIKLTLGWDSDEATHNAILAAFASDAVSTLTIYTPHGDEGISFSAHITKVGRIAAQEDGYKCDVSIQPSGLPIHSATRTFTGKNGAGACTCTGAVVGDIVIALYATSGTYTGVPATDFETVITVNGQIQQIAVADLHLVTFAVKLMPLGT